MYTHSHSNPWEGVFQKDISVIQWESYYSGVFGKGLSRCRDRLKESEICVKRPLTLQKEEVEKATRAKRNIYSTHQTKEDKCGGKGGNGGNDNHT